MKKSEFETIVDKAFRGLEGKYGFRRGETAFRKNGCTVQYLNATTEVCLNFSLGEEPWLGITDLQDPENSSTLEWLLVENGVEPAPTPEQAFSSPHFDESMLESALSKKVKQLLKYATALLKGDFSLMPALKKRASKYEQDCRRYLAQHSQK